MCLQLFRILSFTPYSEELASNIQFTSHIEIVAHIEEECRQRVFENRVLRRIFGPKRDEVTWEWRRLHNKQLYALKSSPNTIRMIKTRRLR
jgi:hypothetical protein